MEIQYIFEILGTIVFAISGASAADEKSGNDWFGVTFVGFITAIGGGSLRDMLLGSYPLVWISDVNFIYAIIAGIVIMRILHNSIDKYRRELALFDTMGIALFTVLGTAKTLDLGFHPRSEERRVGKDYRSRCRCVSTKQELSAYTTRTSELTD